MKQTDQFYIDDVIGEYEKIRKKYRPSTNSDGGPGSGFEGHEGNPGHVGGSVPRSETISNAIDHSLRDATITVDGDPWKKDGDYWLNMMSGEMQDTEGFKKVCAETPDKVELYRSNQKAVDGKNILASGGDWDYDTSKYEYAIDAAVGTQGFDGIPKIVTAEEFDGIAAENKFVAQRTYSASDVETLESYRNDLYNEKFYVDCSTGGAQYGQGMYSAADYSGKLTDGIKAEMDNYQLLGANRAAEKYGEAVADEYMRQISTDEFNKYFDLSSRGISVSDDELNAIKKIFFESSEEDGSANLSETEAKAIKKLEDNRTYADVVDSFQSAYDDVKNESAMAIPTTGYSYTETFTLDKSAKIVKYDEIEKEYREYRDAHPRSRIYDVGTFAALKGYDAINAEGHGESQSYTVVLNRTKMIIREHDEYDEIETKSDYRPSW